MGLMGCWRVNGGKILSPNTMTWVLNSKINLDFWLKYLTKSDAEFNYFFIKNLKGA